MRATVLFTLRTVMCSDSDCAQLPVPHTALLTSGVFMAETFTESSDGSVVCKLCRLRLPGPDAAVLHVDNKHGADLNEFILGLYKAHNHPPEVHAALRDLAGMMGARR
jgi:hypothetical protein